MQVKHLGEKCMGKYVLMLVVLILGFFSQELLCLLVLFMDFKNKPFKMHHMNLIYG